MTIGGVYEGITKAILGDENTIITVSNYDSNNDVFVGLPAVINKNGVHKKIFVDLNYEETMRLQNSIDIIKDAISKVQE